MMDPSRHGGGPGLGRVAGFSGGRMHLLQVTTRNTRRRMELAGWDDVELSAALMKHLDMKHPFFGMSKFPHKDSGLSVTTGFCGQWTELSLEENPTYFCFPARHVVSVLRE